MALFLIPMITMRLFAEEKRSGTIELLLTSPVTDCEIIIGKWLGAMLLYLCVLGMSMINVALLFAWGKPDCKPMLVGYLGLLLQGGCLLAIGRFISTTTKNQIIAGGATFSVCLLLWVLSWFTAFDSTASAQVVNYLSIVTHFENFAKGRARHERRDVLPFHDFLRAVPYRALDGIAAVEGINGARLVEDAADQVHGVRQPFTSW